MLILHFISADVKRRRDCECAQEPPHGEPCCQKHNIWHGRHNLAKILQTLKKIGEENKYTEKIQVI